LELNLSLLPHQEDFLLSEFKHTVLVAGFGSGKTEAAVSKLVVKHIQSRRSVAYYLPNYPLIFEIAVPRIEEFLEENKIKFKYNEQKKRFSTKYGLIILKNLSDPKTIVGYETFYSVIDEIDTLSKTKAAAVFKKILGRNRKKNKKGKTGAIDLVSTPEGFNFLYNFAVKEANENKYLIKAKTIDNPFLPDDYIDTLKSEYTLEELTAYINGEFCNLTSGSVYKSYDRIKNDTDKIAQLGQDLYIGMDFNVQNMHAIVHIIENGTMHAVDEFVKIYNTSELCQLIRERYPNNAIEINPDASCKNRNTAGLSDYDIILDDQWNFNVNIRRKNPEILNRVRGVNKSFEDGKYFVNLAKCPNYSDALGQQVYKNGLPDKTSGLDHILDAGTYAVVEQIFVSGLD
jgi:phage terminase large subunit